MILEDDENVVMVPLFWMSREQRNDYLRDGGYEVIPIPGYQETNGYRTFKIIGPLSKYVWFRELSIPIWEDWKLTAEYAVYIERSNTTTGIQMFDYLDDDEKVQALKNYWHDMTNDHIKKYFREHPDLLERARHSLKREEIYKIFKDLFRK